MVDQKGRIVGDPPFSTGACEENPAAEDGAPPSRDGDAQGVPAACLRVLRGAGASEDEAEQVQLAHHAAQVARRESSDAVCDGTATR